MKERGEFLIRPIGQRRFFFASELTRLLRELKNQKPERNDDTDSVRGRPRIEHKNPQLALDIRLIVEPEASDEVQRLFSEVLPEAVRRKGKNKSKREVRRRRSLPSSPSRWFSIGHRQPCVCSSFRQRNVSRFRR